jgi:DNA polymerase III subunit beta
MMGISAETFPSLPTYDDGEFCSLEVKILKEMIGKTIFAVSTDESRYNLTGVYLVKKEGEENSLRMVATDGYRLSMIDRSFKDQVKGLETGILLPKKGLGEFSKLLDEAGETVSIKIKGSNFIVRKDEVVMVMRLLDAEFPDYKQVIPSRTKKHIRMQRKQTLESLHRVSLLSNEKTRGVKFHFSQDLLEFSTYNPELGEAKEEIPVDYKGEDLVIGFNSRFVLEVLDILGGEEVILELEDGISPGIIRPATDESHTCVIMPMRV